MTFSREANAFLLSFLASLGTFVGGILVCLLTLVFSKTSKQSERSLIGILQALSAGVMLYMSLLDLVPECIEKLGSFKALVLFFLGVFGFLVLDYLIPEAAHEHAHQDHVETEENTVQDSPTKAGLRKRNTKSPSSSPSPSKNKIKRFIALFLHNIPEGLGVYLAAMTNTRLGLQLAPEGACVAIPMLANKKSYVYVLGMTFLNGLAEPLGVLIGGYLLRDFMNQSILSGCLAVVAGFMVCISLHELQPTAISYAGKSSASSSLFVGMFACFVALETVHTLMPHDHHGHDHHGHNHHGHHHH